nr:hypothetical protein [uncultured Flavobacterium sp.]
MDDEEFVELKKEYKQKIEKLEEQLSKNYTSNPSEQDIQRKLNRALDIV